MRAVFLALSLACAPVAAVPASSAPAPVFEVHFSPRGGCTAQTVAHISRAKQSIRVLAYSFTSEPITAALIERHRAGVDVRVVLDRSDVTERGGTLHELTEAGVPLEIDSKHSIAHNKTMVLDDAEVLTGSFNFTTAAEMHNAENCLAVRDAGLAAAYLENWQVHWGHSVAP